MLKPIAKIAAAITVLVGADIPAPAAEAAPFTVNASRVDPYKNFKFRVKWDGRYVAGISKVSGLKRTTDMFEQRDGSQPSITHKAPGRTRFEPITLERGVTHDTAFEAWANEVYQVGALINQTSLPTFRKDVILEFQNEAGQVAIAYLLRRCWPSEYFALPDLDANAGQVAVQKLTLQCESWERDASVAEPAETH